jgi:ClpP class serine protease
MLDPFRPEQPEDLERLKAIQAQVHDTFVDLVRTRRGSRLKGDPETLFSGLVWVGTEAIALGLVDGIGDLRSVMRERFGDKVELRVIADRGPSLLARWLRRRQIPIADPTLLDPARIIGALEEHAAWRRWGL